MAIENRCGQFFEIGSPKTACHRDAWISQALTDVAQPLLHLPRQLNARQVPAAQRSASELASVRA